jgi:hypothetical protein
MPEPSVGQRFSHVYIERGSPLRDSVRFRNRLAEHLRAFASLSSTVRDDLVGLFRRELGVEVNYLRPEDVLRNGELRDALDAITVAYKYFLGTPRAAQWQARVAQVLAEENVGYRVDQRCGLHFSVDEAFEQTRASAIAALQTAALTAARTAVDDAYRHLDGSPIDTKAAVRSIFEAAETIARLICPGQRNLNRWLAENTLKDRCLGVLGQDPTEQTVAAGMFAGLADWVDALHNYRHGQAVAEPAAPSESLTVHALSAGSAFIRLLGECHQRLEAETSLRPDPPPRPGT